MAAATARRGRGRRVHVARPAAASDLYAITRCRARRAPTQRTITIATAARCATSRPVPASTCRATQRLPPRARWRAPGPVQVPASRRALASAAQQRGGHLRSMRRTLAPHRAGGTAPPSSRWQSAQQEVATERAARPLPLSSASWTRLSAEPAPRHAAVVTPRTAAAPHAHEERQCEHQRAARKAMARQGNAQPPPRHSRRWSSAALAERGGATAID